MNMKTAVITGCCGFIGSHLAARLLLAGVRVVGIDNMNTGRMENVQSFIDHPNFELKVMDAKDIDILRVKPYYVFHKAALGSIPRSIQFPEQTFQENVEMFFHVMQYARKYKSKFIFASSSSVYGDIEGMRRENMVNYKHSYKNMYALSKSMNEQMARCYHEIYGLKYVGIRYFNIFGPRQNPNGEYAAVIPKWITRALMDKLLPMTDLKNARDFTYIDTAIDLNMFAMMNQLQGIYNCGTGITVSLKELLAYLETIFKKPLACGPANPRKYEVKSCFANMNRALSDGYTPREYTFLEDLSKTVKHYRSTYI